MADPMTALERQLTRLEAATGVNKVLPAILVSFANPRDMERTIRSMTINDRTYRRADDEPEGS